MVRYRAFSRLPTDVWSSEAETDCPSEPNASALRPAEDRGSGAVPVEAAEIVPEGEKLKA